MSHYKRLSIVFFSVCLMSSTCAQSKKQKIRDLEIELRDLHQDIRIHEVQLEVLRDRQRKNIESMQDQLVAQNEIISKQKSEIMERTLLLKNEEDIREKSAFNLDSAYNEIYLHFSSRVELLQESFLMPQINKQKE